MAWIVMIVSSVSARAHFSRLSAPRILLALFFVSCPLVIPPVLSLITPYTHRVLLYISTRSHIGFDVLLTGTRLLEFKPDIRVSRFLSMKPWPWPLSILYCTKQPLYRTYASAGEEARYWKAAAQYARTLAASDARFGGLHVQSQRRRIDTAGRPVELSPSDFVLPSSAFPLVTYYTPRLLPMYRTTCRSRRDVDTEEYYLAPRTFCKWHRMVFCGRMHPTLHQAEKLIKRYSNRDRQEMFRISRLLSNQDVFGRDAMIRTVTYRDLWRKWLEHKGPDLVIVFE